MSTNAAEIIEPSEQAAPVLSREAQLAAVLTDALDHSAHVYGCGMLNSSVDPENWKACTCWYGRARKLLGITK